MCRVTTTWIKCGACQELRRTPHAPHSPSAPRAPSAWPLSHRGGPSPEYTVYPFSYLVYFLYRTHLWDCRVWHSSFKKLCSIALCLYLIYHSTDDGRFVYFQCEDIVNRQTFLYMSFHGLNHLSLLGMWPGIESLGDIYTPSLIGAVNQFYKWSHRSPPSPATDGNSVWSTSSVSLGAVSLQKFSHLR